MSNNFLRKTIMKVLKLAVVLVVLLSLGILTGCQEGYARHSDSRKTQKVLFKPTVTGFWMPAITH
jgi:hypothetical protein